MALHERKLDRRIQRTRQLLRDALMQLIVEKGYDTLTVQDITDRADVARTTFYLHYRDIDDLLFNSMAEMYKDLMTQGVPFCLPTDENAASATVNPADFEHVQKYADFYRAMLSTRGSMTFLLRVQDYLAMLMQQHLKKVLPPDSQPRVPLEMLAYYWAGAEIGIVTWWLQQDQMQHTPEEMAKLTEVISFNNIIHILGLDNTSQPHDS